MRKITTLITLLTILTLLSVFTFSPYLHAETKDIAAMFPSFDGWVQKDTPGEYSPGNLYEYIDGAADVFLSYDFVELLTLSYEFEKDRKLTFTVDIYLHSNDKNGFGIYSQEKPREGLFLPIGTQGYYEKGILNFLKGSYYIKISGYDLGDNDQTILTDYAEKLAKQLQGTTVFPTAVRCFPEAGKVAGSEGYIAQSFLGHAFLNSAFVTDYVIGEEKIQLFIVETDEPTGAENMLKKYLEFLEKKGVTVELKNDIRRFVDPYYSSKGKMVLKLNKNYLLGLFCKDETQAENLIGQLETNLKQQKLL